MEEEGVERRARQGQIASTERKRSARKHASHRRQWSPIAVMSVIQVLPNKQPLPCRGCQGPEYDDDDFPHHHRSVKAWLSHRCVAVIEHGHVRPADSTTRLTSPDRRRNKPSCRRHKPRGVCSVRGDSSAALTSGSKIGGRAQQERFPFLAPVTEQASKKRGNLSPASGGSVCWTP